MERGDSDWKASEFARLLATVERERRYYQEILGLIPTGIAILNSDREMRWTNRSFRQRFQIPIEKIRSKKFSEMFQSPELDARIHDVFESGAPARSLLLKIEIGGIEREFYVRLMPVRDWDNDIEDQCLMVFEDHTDAWRATATEVPSAPAILEIETPEAAAPLEPAAISALEPEAAEQPPAEEPVAEEAGPAEAPAVAETPLKEEQVPSPPPIPVEPPPPALPKDIPCIVWTAAKDDQRFLTVSDSSETVLGFPAGSWTRVRTFWAERILEEDRTATLEFYDSAIREGAGVHSAEFRMRDDRGQVRWFREIVHVNDVLTGVMFDVTDRRLLEQQYIDSQRFDSIAGFSGDVAHAINNPLTVVSGYSEMLLSSVSPTDPSYNDLKTIQDKSQDIKASTDRLGSLARRERRTAVPINLTDALAALVERIRSAKGPEIDYAEPDQPMWAFAELDHLRTGFLELAATVVEGSALPARLRISSDRMNVRDLTGFGDMVIKPGRYIRVMFEDLNPDPGKKPDYRPLENIFPRRSTGREASVGLVRAFKTFREWGGLAWVAPDGQSAQFILAEAKSPEETAPSQPDHPEEAKPVEPEQVRPVAKSIALVEDEPGIRAMMRKILQRRGYEVLEAGSGEEGLDMIVKREGKFDLLITDVVMPGMNGRELAEKVADRYPQIAILYVSGFTHSTGVESGKFPPGSSFLQKPFSLDTLVHTVADVLLRKEASRTGSGPLAD